METELGPGVAPALARTAELLQADDEALDGWATRSAEGTAGHGTDGASRSTSTRSRRCRLLSGSAW